MTHICCKSFETQHIAQIWLGPLHAFIKIHTNNFDWKPAICNIARRICEHIFYVCRKYDDEPWRMRFCCDNIIWRIWSARLNPAGVSAANYVEVSWTVSHNRRESIDCTIEIKAMLKKIYTVWKDNQMFLAVGDECITKRTIFHSMYNIILVSSESDAAEDSLTGFCKSRLKFLKFQVHLFYFTNYVQWNILNKQWKLVWRP